MLSEALKNESNIISPKKMTIVKNNLASRSLLIKFYQMCLLAFFYFVHCIKASSNEMNTALQRLATTTFWTSFTSFPQSFVHAARRYYSFCASDFLFRLLSVVFFVSRGLSRKFWCFTAAFSSIIQFFEIFRISPKTPSYHILDPDL